MLVESAIGSKGDQEQTDKECHMGWTKEAIDINLDAKEVVPDHVSDATREKAGSGKQGEIMSGGNGFAPGGTVETIDEDGNSLDQDYGEESRVDDGVPGCEKSF